MRADAERAPHLLTRRIGNGGHQRILALTRIQTRELDDDRLIADDHDAVVSSDRNGPLPLKVVDALVERATGADRQAA